ncbi:peptidoglycan-binding domain-containing protein [Roseateles sp. DC23W]|uniref:Peptidoglycan-binding domain-containing protein n=1 Tax=Pelomonas dachongensis TaxID=3299029 RepID=A0ABW7ENJ5_9BURK
MDSRMLEVAIGLALVFALFGLLVTAVHEALAQAMKSRGKTLRVAVVSLLGDNAEMADKLMKHPLLVSMAEGDAKSRLRPSYLSADVFVSALISQLAKDYLPGEDKPPTPGEFVTRLAVKLPTNLADSFKSLLPGAETDWPTFEKRLCAWYDAVGERATGWYKRKTQRDMLLIGTVAAALLNINPIVIGPRLWDDDVLRQSLVTAGEQASKAYSDALQKGTPGDPAVAASAVEAGAAAGVRSLGAEPGGSGAPASKVLATAESAKVEKMLAELKLQLTGAAAVSASAGSDSLVVLLQALDGMSKLVKALDAARLSGDGSLERQRQITQAKLALDAELTALRALAATAAAQPLAGGLSVKMDDLQIAVAAELEARHEARRPRQPPGKCDKAGSPEAAVLCQRMNELNSLQVAGLPVGWSPPYLPNVVQASSCKRVEWTRERLAQEIRNAKEEPDESEAGRCSGLGLLSNPNIWFAFAGWLLMGLAGTLGATFWFDLLTRFVKLRGAGGKPEPAASSSGAAVDATGTTVAGAPAQAGPGGVMARPASDAPPPRTPASSDVLNLAEAGLTTAEVEEVQRRLNTTASGYFNQATRDAIALWQRGRQENETGELTAAQILELLGRPPSGDGEGYVG